MHERVVVDLDDAIVVGVDALKGFGELLDVHAGADELVKGDPRRTASGIGNSC